MSKFLSSKAIVSELDREGSSAREQLIAEGWEESVMKSTSSDQEKARIFTRAISISEKYPEYFARKSVKIAEKMSDTVASKTGSKNNIGSIADFETVKAMRYDEDFLTIALDTEFCYDEDEKNRLVLSYQFAFFDSEDQNIIHQCVFFPTDEKRLPLWRVIGWIITKYNLCKGYDYRLARRWYATVKKKNDELCKKIFNSPEDAFDASVQTEERGLLLDQFDDGFEDGKNHRRSKDNGQDCGYFYDFSAFYKKEIVNKITLVCHFGSADLSTFEIPRCEQHNETSRKDILDVLSRCRQVQGGLITPKDSYENIKLRQKFYPIRFQVRDTMCFAPAGEKQLKSLGEAISVNKLELPYDAICHMDQYFPKDPVHYMEYAINDSVICLLYSSELWGINKKMGMTVTSGAAKAALAIIKKHFEVDNNDDFDLVYRGLQKECKGKKLINYSNGRSGFTDDTSYEPISDDAFLLINAAANAYHGGLNGCFGARFVDTLTHDFDLQNAYPTSMSCIVDPDWSNLDSLITQTIEKRFLTLEDFESPYDLIFGDIEFEFPNDVLFPCIPVNVNGSLIFPQTSEGLTKCYASGTEIFLALKLGAKVKARRVYKAAKKIMPDGSPSKCLHKVCKQYIHERNLAKEIWGNKSFEQGLQKVSINSIYGKIAQSIKPKTSWNAATSEMEEVGWSQLTSPVHACLITAGVRAVLNATANQLSKLGYKCYSITTDGLISDASFEVLNGLDLYGFGEIFREARMLLTGSSDMWEEKHTNTSFLNISTRGNVSQDLGNENNKAGVCAHNGLRPSYNDPIHGEVVIKHDGAIDRYTTLSKTATREGRVRSPEKRFTGFKDLSYHGKNLEKRKDFVPKYGERNLRMDFDMKRKPLESSFEQTFFTIQGVTEKVMAKGVEREITLPDIPNCEWVNFDSIPYASVAEYEAYKRVYDSTDCLRTKADWDKFWLKIHAMSSNEFHRIHVKDVSWTILMSCVMGHRLGDWNIPALSDPTKSVEEKVAWINKFNTSSKKFTVSSWKNCRRRDRVGQMIKDVNCCNLLHNLLQRMITDTSEEIKSL